jgi:hypothetical protein
LKPGYENPTGFEDYQLRLQRNLREIHWNERKDSLAPGEGIADCGFVSGTGFLARFSPA